MRLPAAAGALFPLAGEEKKSKGEAECHRPDTLALAAGARQLQRDLKLRPSQQLGRVRVRRGVALAKHAPSSQIQSIEPRKMFEC
jgi:hypothetical protein